MVTRQFNSVADLKNWISRSLIFWVERQGACINEIDLDTYSDRYHSCDILHAFAGECWCAVYHVEMALKGFTSTESDCMYVADDYSAFLRLSVRRTFNETCNVDFGCSLIDSLVSFLDDLEVYDKNGVVYVEY